MRVLLEPLIDRFQLIAEGAVVLLDLNGKAPLTLEALLATLERWLPDPAGEACSSSTADPETSVLL